MLDFRQIRIEDKKLLEQSIPEPSKIMCDFSFGNLFCWSAVENTEVAQKEGFVFLRSRFNGKQSYVFPWGNGDVEKALKTLENDAAERTTDFSFYCICEEQAQILSQVFSQRLVLTEQRDYFDYVYLRDSLAQLKGRKFHSKKNHVNSFCKNYEYSYETVNPDNIGECRSFTNKWYEEKGLNPKLAEEKKVMEKAFDNFFELRLSGAFVRVDGEIVAFAAGEPLPDDKTYCTHFEKASAEYPTAYAAVNKLFAENLPERYIYINREDDAGSEDLRKAKTSYNPEFLVKKYYAKIK